MNCPHRATKVALSVSLSALLMGCSGLADIAPSGASGSLISLTDNGPGRGRSSPPSSTLSGESKTRGLPSIAELGSTDTATPQGLPTDQTLATASVQLSFVDTDVREFARVLFSQLLHKPYVVDPKVSGTITVRSGGNVDGNTALAMAARALEASGNSLSISDGVYRIAGKGPGSPDASGSLKTFALAHIDGNSAQKALGPLIGQSAQVVSAGKGNITVRGDTETLALVGSLLSTIDIDRFKSSSFGLFPLQSAKASDAAGELQSLLAGSGVTNQTIVPIERMNALLVVVDRPDYLVFAQKWIARLDQGREDERKIYVYQVKNREAPDLAKILQSIFASASQQTAAQQEATPAYAPAQPDPAVPPALVQPKAPVTGTPTDSDTGVKITADSGSNTLVIWAKPAEYTLVQNALVRLDTPLKQVFVEATIAEVRLNGELSHGVRWFFQSGHFGAGVTDTSSGSVTSEYPGFNFSFEVPSAQIVISALESYTNVKIVSSPQLTVVDRQSATIQVGDQVPIATRSVVDEQGNSAVIANDISFRDTGVILKITPEIRPSGEVLLNIDQQVSNVVPTTSSNINSPTISQRKVSSTVLVPDGMAIVLGGLMNTSQEDGGGGLPGTPHTLLGGLFGSQKKSNARSELIVIVRPQIIQDSGDLAAVVKEVADKMKDTLSVSR